MCIRDSCIGVPIGLFTAINLAEIAPVKLRKILKSAIELLAGIPSVVYGLSLIHISIEAMRHCDEEIEKMRQAYLARRNFLVKTFNEMGLKTFTPQGAFYVFPCIKSTGLTSEQFCEELLNDQLVACVPGSAFGEAGEGYIRVSYAYSLEELKAATKKIRKFLENKGVI